MERPGSKCNVLYLVGTEEKLIIDNNHDKNKGDEKMKQVRGENYGKTIVSKLFWKNTDTVGKGYKVIWGER